MWDNIAMALQSLRSNKMRALLTMLGIIIGIGAVIAIETVGNSLSGSITDQMANFGVSNISVAVTAKTDEDQNALSKLFRRTGVAESDRITDEMLAEYRQAFSDKIAYIEISESVGRGTFDDADGETATLTVTGVGGDYLPSQDIKLLYGRNLKESDGTRKICMIADKFATDEMGISPGDAIGKELRIKINNTPYLFYIAGVYEYEEEETLYFSFGEKEIVTNLYLPLETAKEMTGAKAGYSSFTVVTAADTDTPSFLSTTEKFFASFYTHNDSWTVEASSLESLVSTLTEILDKVSIAISAIAAISLLVGGIGVMNIMLVSVTERTKEIGTRKALGAKQSAIRLQFIVESMVICLIGGILGILLGFALGAFACNLLGYPARADVESILLVTGISLAIGLFFGYYPANKAAKLNPIDALRYE